MQLNTYQCSWTNEWVAYDEAYLDDFTPHGRGSTLDEAIEELKDAMESYFKCQEDYDAWVAELKL